jgi:bacillithiol biosynthesis deacetylase BshB1
MDNQNAPQPLHVLAAAAHPDDVELTCGGTLIKLARAGYRVGVLDLTRGEMATRGTPEQRLQEAQEAARIMDLAVRENAGLPDGRLSSDGDLGMALVRALRKWRPALWLVPCSNDRHPDHAAVGRAGLEAAFLAGLRKMDTGQPMFRPTWTLQYLCRHDTDFSFIVDVSDVFEARLEAIRAYHSQFDAASGDPQTYISRPQFLDMIVATAKFYGSKIEAAYGEPFLSREALRVDDPVAFLAGTRPEWATLR